MEPLNLHCTFGAGPPCSPMVTWRGEGSAFSFWLLWPAKPLSRTCRGARAQAPHPTFIWEAAGLWHRSLTPYVYGWLPSQLLSMILLRPLKAGLTCSSWGHHSSIYSVNLSYLQVVCPEARQMRLLTLGHTCRALQPRLGHSPSFPSSAPEFTWQERSAHSNLPKAAPASESHPALHQLWKHSSHPAIGSDHLTLLSHTWLRSFPTSSLWSSIWRTVLRDLSFCSRLSSHGPFPVCSCFSRRSNHLIDNFWTMEINTLHLGGLTLKVIGRCICQPIMVASQDFSLHLALVASILHGKHHLPHGSSQYSGETQWQMLLSSLIVFLSGLYKEFLPFTCEVLSFYREQSMVSLGWK